MNAFGTAIGGRPRSKEKQTMNVCFGSLADITACSRHVRFAPDSGHSSVQVGCPTSANSGHRIGEPFGKKKRPKVQELL